MSRSPLQRPPSGLSAAEAAARLSTEGPNSLPGRDSRGLVAIAVQTLREPMFALLVVAGIVYLALGDPAEAAVLLALACLTVGIAIIQEFRSERVLQALRDLSAPVSAVIRDGQRRRIASADLVSGDVVELSEGERVPADCVLRRGDSIQTDESLLTGESVPVDKRASSDAVPMRAPGGGERTPFLYSGTLVVRGQGLAEVLATGARSELGRLGGSLQTIVDPPGRLTLETRRIVRTVGAFAICVCAAVVLMIGFGRGAWMEGLLAGIALAMALLPEEFPLVLTVFMVMGARRLSKANVLTRRAAAIETLGSATVLCTDKTGTLTQNRMRVVAVWVNGHTLEWSAEASPPEGARALLEASLLASAEHPFDPMERAFHDACANRFTPSDAGLRLDKTFGLTAELMAVSNVWTQASGGTRRIASKGAPESILRLCVLSDEKRAQAVQAVEAMAALGMRVLAVAEGEALGRWRPAQGGLRFLGLVGLADPLRPDVADAVRQCREAGVRVVMITGDHPSTAAAIARRAGLVQGQTLTGSELSVMDDLALAARAPAVTVFARILPEQKLRIVQALQAAGDVVAMTGDGVNDAPALKAADIGVAMGARGTDVARSAADLVLLDDSFASIVRGMRQGRRIYDNLQKAMGFILAVHVPIAGLALFPLLLGLPMLLVPAHIAFLEMIIDPVCSMVFEAEREERGVMRRPPRDPRAALFTASRIGEALAQGAVALAAVIAVFVSGRAFGLNEGQIRGASFVALVACIFGLVLANRSRRSVFAALARGNTAFSVIVLGVTLAIAAVAASAPLRELFRFGETAPVGWALAAAGGAGCLLALEALKLGLRLFGRRAAV
ncbi:MAG TPA: cation-translocating P-type ATPase [Caulobacteraceae bacterium]|nr:cation-translocating P-type ATPase [Caulobacteraceae bacterium]